VEPHQQLALNVTVQPSNVVLLVLGWKVVEQTSWLQVVEKLLV